MKCPLINSACTQSDCTFWLENQCAIVALATGIIRTATPPRISERDPKSILSACANHLKCPGITALSRREIDDFLASSNTVLNAEERRALLRTWRDIRRVNRERIKGTGIEWKSRPSNQGKAWSIDEDEDIQRSYKEGQSIGQISTSHKRSEIAVRYRLEKYGLVDK